jgi:hypothetical protein
MKLTNIKNKTQVSSQCYSKVGSKVSFSFMDHLWHQCSSKIHSKVWPLISSKIRYQLEFIVLFQVDSKIRDRVNETN